ncbi:MAG TPA: hypothetical protein VMV95_03090 [Bacillota bacterium]|nr:hypothetical protein [Bacillota bacterium]
MGKSILVIALLFLLAIPLISSVGVANSYWDDNPLKLAPGESTTISLRLQNEEEEQITMEVYLDSEIASLVDGTEYDVPPGKISVPVYIKVSIPKDANIGTTYTIPVSFKQISSGEGGMIRLSQGITGKVPIEVVGEEESGLYGTSKGLNTFWIMGIVLLVLIVLIISVRKQKIKR